MEQKIVQHKHCSQCGRAIISDKELCSDKCKREWDALAKKRRWNLYIFYIMIAVFIIILLLQLGLVR